MIYDCAGLKFWKSPRRKIYAVRISTFKGKTPRKRPLVDSDSEEEPVSKRSKNDITKVVSMVDDVRDDLFRTESKVDDVKTTLETMKREIQDILHLDQASNVPMGLKHMVRNTFQCKICLGIPMSPPVVMAKCCKTIIGCEQCINRWYAVSEALTKSCPNCRVERGYSEIMILRGLDSFLTEAREVVGLSGDNSHSGSD